MRNCQLPFECRYRLTARNTWDGFDLTPLPVNPAHAVRGGKHSQQRGKTPMLQADEMRALHDAISTFSRVGAAVSIKAEDY
jgi:hypothetical protein